MSESGEIKELTPSDNSGFHARNLNDGNWFWADKAILKNYAKHIGALGIAVYSCLASFVDANQMCYPTQEQIGEMLGYSRASVSKAIRLLEQNGLILVDKRDRYNCIYRLPSLRCKANNTQMLSTGNPDVKQRNTNNIHVTRINNNKGGQHGVLHNTVALESKDLLPAIQNEALALELAESLDDLQHLSRYLSYTGDYPESLLRAVIQEVCRVPTSQIRKSRSALFRYLVRFYAKQ